MNFFKRVIGMKKKKLLLINIMLVVSMVSTMTGCTKKTVAANAEVNKDKKVIEAKKEEANKSSADNKVSSTAEPAKPSTPVLASNSTPTSQKPEQPEKPTQPQVNATPEKTAAASNVRGKIIVIDPGHANRSNLQTEAQAPGSSVMKIKDGGGAQGVATGTPEYLVNMRVSVKLKGYLEQKGYTVIMTKTDNSVSLGNIERAQIWNNANAALAIRIHADSSDSSSIRGASMLVPAAISDNTKAIYSESKRCGQIVLDNLVKEVGMTNRGVVAHDDMTGFNWSKVPVILVEMGFLSNPDEDRLLSSSDYEDKLARALADGIAQAVK